MVPKTIQGLNRAEGKELQLGKTPTKTLEEAFAEVSSASMMLASAGPLAEVFAHDFQALAIELLHWMYDTTGTHKSITDIVFESIDAHNKQEGKTTKLDA